MPIIELKLAKRDDRSYKILIEDDCTLGLERKLNKIGQKYAIITDKKVQGLYGNVLKRYLNYNGIKADIFPFQNGEKQKTLQTVEKLADQMIKAGYQRKDAIIALGGGVVGDVAGLLASIYMRGIPLIQIPTTLLSMVDSSIGGKTGVNLKSGKNLIGTFYQPKMVFIDQRFLKTLSPKQIKNGLAEIIKYGVIKDKELFEYIEKNLEKILNLERLPLKNIISRSIEIKSKIVEKDEKEGRERMILNYGHTYGHAIEKQSNYKLLHGYAISIGMVLANKFAVKSGILKQDDADRIKTLLKNTGLPTTTVKKPTKKQLMTDKKADKDHLNFILPRRIGQVTIHKEKCQ